MGVDGAKGRGAEGYREDDGVGAEGAVDCHVVWGGFAVRGVRDVARGREEGDGGVLSCEEGGEGEGFAEDGGEGVEDCGVGVCEHNGSFWVGMEVGGLTVTELDGHDVAAAVFVHVVCAVGWELIDGEPADGDGSRAEHFADAAVIDDLFDFGD